MTEDDALLRQCLRQQIDEFDMVSSVYCQPGELLVDDHSIAADINEYLTQSSPSPFNLTSKLDYRICLNTPATGKVDVRVELPHYYPALEHPYITVRASCYSKQQDQEIKRQIDAFIANEVVDKEEPYAFAIISWIQENLERFLTVRIDAATPEVVSSPKLVTFERLWIYSHHIKSEKKRHTLVNTARDLDLSGFSRPGWPGIICVEGLHDNTQEYWKIIRGMKWKKIRIRIVEQKRRCVEELDGFRRFPAFREMLFADASELENGDAAGKMITMDESDGEDSDEASGGSNKIRMDMSVFMKYLEKHNSLYVRKELFGFTS
jgi:Protein of unknown function (DUF1115)/RWD domain